MGSGEWLTWREAMASALYGDTGFYTAAGAPGRNFRTSAHLGSPAASPAWAAAIYELARRVDTALGSPPGFAVADVGAGGGELLAALEPLAPEGWSLVGVDVAPRPAGLPARVQWQPVPPPTTIGLLLAVELLDVVPVDVVERDGDDLRVVEVSPDGQERLGAAVDGPDAEWLARWWPLAETGDRAEIGRPRDELWRTLTGRLERGLAVAVDYAAVPARDLAGTLTGYRDGRQTVPVPDGSGDLTAHVLFESLTLPNDVTLLQRTALQALGIDGRRPTYAGDDAPAYLAELSASGEAAELLDPGGLGGFTWLLHPEGLVLPGLTN